MTLQSDIFYKLHDPQAGEMGVVYSQILPGVKSHSASRSTFIGGMRHVATSVTIVTTDGPAGRLGATVSAFSAVSADPPTVLVCLRSDSRICSAVSQNRVFTVSVLPEHDQDLARVFAGEFDTSVADRFDGIDVETFSNLAPGIQGASIFACTIVQMIVQHTHTIVIGNVAQVVIGQHCPLLYHDAGYQRLQCGRDASFV